MYDMEFVAEDMSDVRNIIGTIPDGIMLVIVLAEEEDEE